MATVTVGCKLPHGLVIKVGGKSATLAGANSSRIIGGYGLTLVDKDLYEAWSKEYAGYAPLKNHLIFVQEKANSAESQARDQAQVKSGLEPLDIEKPVAGVKPESYEGKPSAEDE